MAAGIEPPPTEAARGPGLASRTDHGGAGRPRASSGPALAPPPIGARADRTIPSPRPVDRRSDDRPDERAGERADERPDERPDERAGAGSILDEHRADAPVTITHESIVAGDVAEQLWATYDGNFSPLADVAVQAQSSGRDEMLAEFANPRILKIVAWQRGRPVGLGMVTNHLESVPDISPGFLRASFPGLAERDAIYIGMYVMVEPGHRGLTLFHRLYLEMWQVPARAGGVLVFDVCEFNRTTFQTDQLAERIAANFPRSSVSVLDRQTWYAARLPEPIPEVSRPRGRGR